MFLILPFISSVGIFPSLTSKADVWTKLVESKPSRVSALSPVLLRFIIPMIFSALKSALSSLVAIALSN